mgnify:CR=1 FL=1
MNGVTPYGFVKMRLPEIRQAIAADLKNRLVARFVVETGAAAV